MYLGCLHDQVRNYESHAALDGGPDGLHLIREILQTSRSEALLRPGGIVVLEVDSSHTETVMADVAAAFGFELVSQHADWFKNNRFSILRNCFE